MMVENLAMSSQAKDVFCIWLVSPLLRKSFFTRYTCNICLVSNNLMKNCFSIIVFQYGSLSRPIFAYNFYVIELQLKDHHQPLRMRMKWPDLLRRFTTASTEVIEKGKKAYICSCTTFCRFTYKIFKRKPMFIQYFLCVSDEPILSFQRNSFFPLQEERKVER